MMDSVIAALNSVAGPTSSSTTTSAAGGGAASEAPSPAALAEEQETQRLLAAMAQQRRDARSGSQGKRAAGTELGTGEVIPPLVLKPREGSSSAMCMPALSRAARAVEAQLLLRCVAQWENVCNALWRALAREATAEFKTHGRARNATLAPEARLPPADEVYHVSYAGFVKVVAEIEPLRRSGLATQLPQVRVDVLEAELREHQRLLAEDEAAQQNQQQSEPQQSQPTDEAEGAAEPPLSAEEREQIVAGAASLEFTSGFYRTACPEADDAADALEARMLEFYADFLPKIDATLFLSCARNARTGTVDVRALYENLQLQIAVAKFAGEMLLLEDSGDRVVRVDRLEYHVQEALATLPGNDAVLGRGLVEAHKVVQTERFAWLLDKRGANRFDLREMLMLPELRDMLLHPLKAEELSAHPRESVRWFACATTSRLFDEFDRLDGRRKRLLALGDFRRYRKFLREAELGPSPLPMEVSPLSYSFIKRYFETTPTYQGELDFRCFVRFVLNVELLPQQCPRPDIFFDCFDTDGIGVLTPTRMGRFMSETRAKLAAEFDSYGATAERQVDDLFHLIKTARPYEITRREFLQSVNKGLFCSLVIDVEALMAYEQRDWTNPKIKQEELGQRPFSGRR